MYESKNLVGNLLGKRWDIDVEEKTQGSYIWGRFSISCRCMLTACMLYDMINDRKGLIRVSTSFLILVER